MAIPKFEEDLAFISKLGDNPGTDNGYSSQEFKEAFDKAPLMIQKYINDVLIPAANASSSPEEGLNMTGPINMNGQALSGLNAPTADDQAVNWGSVKEWGKAKAGFIYPLAASVVPEGFLLCDGAAYSRTEYPELFAAIGTMYGSGDGSTTFNVPDLRNRVPAGSSENHPAGEMVGEETHQLTVDEMPSHRFKTYFYTDASGSYVVPAGYSRLSTNSYIYGASEVSGKVYGQLATTDTLGGDQSHNTMQPTTYIKGYIIATGKGTGVSVSDIIMGAQALPLEMKYGGVGATDPKTARENLEVAQAIKSTEYPGCYYRTVDGETEWLNPPMLPGVEYRTTERWNGKPVYKKRVKYTNSTAISGNALHYIPHGITSYDRSHGVKVTVATPSYLFPYFGESLSQAVAVTGFSATNIELRTTGNSNWSVGRTWNFDVSFVKPD